MPDRLDITRAARLATLDQLSVSGTIGDVRSTEDAQVLLADGLAAIRHRYEVPTGFPPEVAALAEQRAVAGPMGIHRDRTDEPFVTLDPESATDLDQAFHVTSEGDALVLHYAIADVSAWVVPGDAIDIEAWQRGVTIYAADGKASLYPEVLSAGAASLLPDGPRPAVVVEVVVGLDGSAHLSAAERAMVRSRDKLAYEHITPGDLPAEVNELARRVAAAEEARGASRIEFPEQELVTDATSPAGVRLAPRPRRPSEDTNSYLSLAANLAVAALFVEHRTGLFRTMDEPSRSEVRGLRKVAAAYGIDWPSSLTLRQLNARLDDADPSHVAFLLAARRSGGGATYAAFDDHRAPWHSAIAAAYSHATAPMRRLADRYVLDAVLDLMAGRPTDSAPFARLPEVMERAETVAGKVDRATIDLVESVELADRVGEVFSACVLEPGDASVVQIADPMVRARVPLGVTEPGQQVRLRLVSADPTHWTLRFEPA